MIENQRRVEDLEPDEPIWHPPRSYNATRAHLDEECKFIRDAVIGPVPARSWILDRLVCSFCDPEVDYSQKESGDSKDRSIVDALKREDVTELDQLPAALEAERADEEAGA